MISETLIPEEKRKIVFKEGLHCGRENKAQGLGTDDWPGDPPPFIRNYAKEIFHSWNPKVNVNSTGVFEIDEFDIIESELEDIFLNGYHQAFEE